MTINNKKVYIYDVQNCENHPPKGGLWAQGASYAGTKRITYGIEKFFINENNPLKDAKSGEVLAKVKIDRYHKLRLLDLESIGK